MYRGVIDPTLFAKLMPKFDKTLGSLTVLTDSMAEHLRKVLYRHLSTSEELRSMLGRIDDLWVQMQQPAVIRRKWENADGRLDLSVDWIYITIERAPDDPP